MLSLTQRLSQQQKLSPQQIQYQKLLQLNSLALEQRIKTELELNPFLEEDFDQVQEVEADENEADKTGSDDAEEATAASDEADYADDSVEEYMKDYMNDEEYYDDIAAYRNKNENYDEDKMQPIAPAKEGLGEHLLQQLYLQNIPENLMALGEEIIGSLDEDGYLKRDLDKILSDLKAFQHIDIPAEVGEQLLKLIQTFDPVGIASRTLKECLLVQIQNLSYDPYYSFLAENMLENHFDDFVHKRFESMRDKMQLSQETLRSVVDLIQKLNPKPGEGNIESAELNQITPDFFVEKVDDNYIVTLNDRSMQSITINKQYLELLGDNRPKSEKTESKDKREREKQTYKFLREKFESAKWFLACIEQRKNTLMKVMQSIVTRQYKFFDLGTSYLKPMIYKDVAEEIEMDISTISRVVNGKFVQSVIGIHELKYFFSEGLETDSGDPVSNKKIKERVKDLVESENKESPLSDDAIAEILQEEGVHIARRTIAKYREQLRIPVARMRREA